MATNETAIRATTSSTAHSEPNGFVRRTVYNAGTQEYGEELIPLREAYEEAIARLGVMDAERSALTRKYEIQDLKFQHASWRKGAESADKFRQSLNDLFKSTLNSAKRTYNLLTAMSVTMFITGLALFVFAGLYATLSSTPVYSLVFAGLGASSFVALFIVRPFDDAQAALSDMIQGEMAFMAWFEQIRMWANYPWGKDGLDEAKVDKASRILHKRTAEVMEDLQRFVEHSPKEAEDGRETLSNPPGRNNDTTTVATT